MAVKEKKQTPAKSQYRDISIKGVIAEYREASLKKNDYEKAKWSSHQSMLNRFKLCHLLVDWQRVNTWLDAGCSTGALFEYVDKAGIAVPYRFGVDAVNDLIKEARSKNLAGHVKFFADDLVSLADDGQRFDLVTSIGTLQQCGHRPADFIGALCLRLKAPGQIFLTTKNIGWCEFTSGRLDPDPHHSWFDFNEIEGILGENHISIKRSGGFLPQTNKIVAANESHTMFFWGTKRE
ncbi:MAG: methyltransferase domain-containing protein [Deltaproteobacteria bacterium]|nr:methyltransferase domain-containing protein [Deltaproteobacteria bacterium]